MPQVAKFRRPIPAQPWRELNDTQRKVYTKLQEVFAGFLGTDDKLGTLITALDEMGIADNTLVIFLRQRRIPGRPATARSTPTATATASQTQWKK
jgi:arylsulfatase